MCYVQSVTCNVFVDVCVYIDPMCDSRYMFISLYMCQHVYVHGRLVMCAHTHMECVKVPELINSLT
jgi:hypothetical protein